MLFIVVYRRWGGIAFLLVLFGAIGAAAFGDTFFGRFLPLFAAGALCWMLADKADEGDHFYFIPIRVWAILSILGALIWGVAGASRFGPSRFEEKPQASVATSSPSARYEPTRAAMVPDLQPAPRTQTAQTVAAAEPEMPQIEQVYADNASKTYYPENCTPRPDNVFRISKSMAVRQGYKRAAACPP